MNDKMGEAFVIVKQLRMDLTAAQAKLTELNRALNALKLPAQPKGVACPHCGVLRSTEALARDHLANVHGIEAC